MLHSHAPASAAPTPQAARRRYPWASFDALPAGVCAVAPSGRIAYANPALHALLGRPDDSLAGCAAAVLGCPAADGGAWSAVRGDGSRIWLAVAVSPYTADDGRRYDLHVVTDVTRHRQIARPDEARLDIILEQSPIGVSVSRRDTGIIQFANTRFAELIGLPRDRIVGSRARDYYVDDQQRAQVLDGLKDTGSVVNMEVQFRRADGSAFWTLFTVNQTVLQGMPVNLAWIYDYTERRNMEEALRDLAAKDPLTGILNRRSFMDLARQRLARARRRGEPLSMLVLDVDHFKRVNDRYGHAAGDEALRLIAGGCQRLLREHDVLGRLGGEEFVACLSGTTADEACVVAERLRRSLSRIAVPGPGGPFRLTASIGVAGVDESVDTVEAAIHNADLALYRAKNAGRNRVAVHRSGI
ncbi:sensor domain-containing diguanylate cyclase [Azospirillum sp. A39]|uniref:sensor domain-containing diguanylate cyclase n=1 Tax=Azospirillum sp. A39 TaxID=3462279 RepID=UPI0040468219